MFVVYSPEGRNFIGAEPHTRRDRVTRVNPIAKTEFDETMMELDKDLPEQVRRHQQTHYALNQYQKQLDTMHDRHVVVTVSEIMSSPVITLSSDGTWSDGWALMQKHGIQHVPIVDSARLVGICSLQALLRQVIVNSQNQIETDADRPLMEIANREVITTVPQTDVRRAAFVMDQYRIGGLPVMSDSGELIGMITRSDLIKRLAKLPPLEIYA